MKMRINKAYLIANNWRIWQRLPRLAALAKKIFHSDVSIEEEKKRKLFSD